MRQPRGLYNFDKTDSRRVSVCENASTDGPLADKSVESPYCGRLVSELMRILATIQILLLLMTTLLPEGRFPVLAMSCDSTCGCSAESKESGPCCCTRSKKSTAKATTSRSCCSGQSRKTNKPKCCSGHSNRPSQEKHDSRPRDRDLIGKMVVEKCPCGSDDAGFAVVHSPRNSAVNAQVQTTQDRCALNTLTSKDRTAEGHPPDVPPPQLSCC